MSKRQDEWERTSQSPPTVTDQCEKDKTSGMSGSAQARQSPTTVIDQCQKDKTSGSAQVHDCSRPIRTVDTFD